MSDSTSDAEELQAVSVLIPDLLRRILPLAEDMRGDDALHAAVSARGSHSLLAPSDGANSCTDAREQAAEDLCDLVASPSSAQVAVRCMAFQILVEVAGHALSSTQNRVAELCMGTLANITCHKKLAEEVRMFRSSTFTQPKYSVSNILHLLH